jgi:hypothetical protein
MGKLAFGVGPPSETECTNQRAPRKPGELQQRCAVKRASELLQVFSSNGTSDAQVCDI